MNLDRYAVLSTSDRTEYNFFSKGPCGRIKKVVLFQKMIHNYYNLAFGDWNKLEQRMDDKARSNNGDMDKVFATVAFAVLDFLKYYPEAIVVAMGSTPARTRLYQIRILANLHSIAQLLNIEGDISGVWHPVERQKNYKAFMVRPKQ